MLSLRDVLKQWLEHRREVLVRRSEYRLKKIEHRLEVLDGYLIAYLNLDEVIRIVRFEDEPKARLMAAFKLSDVQAEAILNLRLRSLSRLEEMEIKARARQAVARSARDLKALLKSDELQWDTHRRRGRATREKYSQEDRSRPPPLRPSPTRRTIEVDLDEAMIEKEPVTVILSEKGWIRALKGHLDDLVQARVQAGRRPASGALKALDHRQARACSPPTASSSRWRPTSCPAAAATASRCA